MEKCTQCEERARFDSPAHLCSTHWVDWWCEGYDMSDPKNVAYKEALLEECRLEDAEDDAAAQMEARGA